MSISKRRVQPLRALLVHGARAVVRTAATKTDPLITWVNALIPLRRHTSAVPMPRSCSAGIAMTCSSANLLFNTSPATIRAHYWHHSPRHQERALAIVERRR